MKWVRLREQFPPFGQLLIVLNPDTWTQLARFRNVTEHGLCFVLAYSPADRLAPAVGDDGQVQDFWWCEVTYPEDVS